MIRTEKMSYDWDSLLNYIEEVKQAVYLFDKKGIDQKTIRLYLANKAGRFIEYKLTKSSLPHILGIQTGYLIETGNYGKSTSNLLEKIINDPIEFLNSLYRNRINPKKVFSKYCYTKMDLFKKDRVDLKSIAFVCDYKRYNAYDNEEGLLSKDAIIIGFENESDDGLNLLYLVEKNDRYIPYSATYYETKKEALKSIKPILRHQELTMATSMIITVKNGCPLCKASLYAKDKKEALEKLNEFGEESNISVAGDYGYTLNGLNMKKTASFYQSGILKNITCLIKEGKIITEDDIKMAFEYLNPEIYALIMAWNDNACAKNIGGNISSSYSQTIEELKLNKEKLKEAKEKLEEAKQKTTELTQENETLRKDSEAFEEIVKIVRERRAE